MLYQMLASAGATYTAPSNSSTAPASRPILDDLVGDQLQMSPVGGRIRLFIRSSPLLPEQLPHHAQGWASILPPKVVPVVQVVEELVQQQAFVKPWSLGDLLVVGSEEGSGEPPKHQRDRQFKLRMAIEGSWIVNNGPLVILSHIARPEVSMEQGGDNLYTREQVWDLHLEEKVLQMWDTEAHGFIIQSLEIEQRAMDSSRVHPNNLSGPVKRLS